MTINNKNVDPKNAFLIELIPCILGLMGIGYLYSGYTQEGILRLIFGGFIFGGAALAILVFGVVSGGLGCLLLPLVTIFVGYWSANSLKKRLLEQSIS
jgi:TM2 domain-containing membrane protein YozV